MALTEGLRIASCLNATLLNGWRVVSLDGNGMLLEKEGFAITFDKIQDARYFIMGLEAAYNDAGVM